MAKREIEQLKNQLKNKESRIEAYANENLELKKENGELKREIIALKVQRSR